MTISTVLKTVYASAPTGIVILSTLELRFGAEVIRLVHGYEDMLLGVDGTPQKFEACAMDVALPDKDTSGNQTLNFALGLVDGRAYGYVRQALDTGSPAQLIYREYLSTDLSAPAKTPVVMTVAGGGFVNGQLQVEASYYDLLNSAWPRERYTIDKAPGLKYL